LPSNWPRTSRRLISGGAAAVDGFKTLQIEIGSAAIDHEQADAAAIVALARGTGGDDQVIRPGRGDDSGLFPGQDVIVALEPCGGRDIGEVEARSLLGPGQRPDLDARNDVGNEALLLLTRARVLDQAARQHNRLDERFHDEMAAEFLHDDHGRQRTAAETAGILGKRRGKQAEFGKGLPLLAAEAVLAGNDVAAGVEIILVAQQALDAGTQQFLLFRELYVHPILLWRCC
jgi:hypothetical protein